jgi:hypothetical protein
MPRMSDKGKCEAGSDHKRQRRGRKRQKDRKTKATRLNNARTKTQKKG